MGISHQSEDFRLVFPRNVADTVLISPDFLACIHISSSFQVWIMKQPMGFQLKLSVFSKIAVMHFMNPELP